MSHGLLEARQLVKRFGGPFAAGPPAVAGIDLTVHAGECLAIVGPSGGGKSTLARMLVRLLEPSSGTLRFDGRDLLTMRGSALRAERRRFQIVFQEPGASLDPRMRVGASLAEPLRAHGLAARRELPERVGALLGEVGLAPGLAGRYPHELSGGQRQRVAIARALATGPELLVADEPVSALDVAVGATILDLLDRLRRERGLALVLVSHDLAVVEAIADRVAVMAAGRFVEEGPVGSVLRNPADPTTRALLAAAPRFPVASPGTDS